MSTAANVGGSSRSEQGRTWQAISARCLAATLLAYFLVYKLGQAISLFLPMPRSEIVYLVGLSQMLALVPLVLWIFTTRSVPRMLAIMLVVTAASTIIVHLHGPV